MTKLTFLPTGNATVSPKELIIAREVLEIGTEYSVAIKDIPSFERYMSQLKCYYYDYKLVFFIPFTLNNANLIYFHRNLIGESKSKYQLLGLNLLFLLSQNRVAEFHTELELLPADIIQTNKYVRHPLALEQCLMEGRYNKIFLAKGNAPAESYNFFTDILLDTVRNEIAACLEKAYEKISFKDLGNRLHLNSIQEVQKFAAKVIMVF